MGNKGTQPECYIRKYFGKYPSEKLHADSLWEVTINSFSERGNVGVLDDEYGNRTLKLRHFTTGRFLMLSIIKEIPVLAPYIEDLSLGQREEWDKYTEVKLQKTDITQGDLIDNDQTYGLKIDDRYIIAADKSQKFMANRPREDKHSGHGEGLPRS